MTSNQPHRQRDDSAMFDAYVSLRRVAQEYNLEDKLSIPRVVFVGETSSGKSMLVQNFLRFPCAFSKSDVGTRCPVLYRLRYNPNLSNGTILIKHPPNINRPEQLAEHLGQVMATVERNSGFSSDEYLVHIESNQYRDFEILDVPGLIGGCRDAQREEAVERITENYVRDPKFLIVQLKEALQLPENSFGMKRIHELCRAEPALRGSSFPARRDYENSTITIQTKFDSFMSDRQHPTTANNDMERLLGYFNEKTLFTSMIFEGYDFSNYSDAENTRYIADLPRLEEEFVNKWIRKLNQTTPSNRSSEGFNEARYRPLIGINLVRNRIQDMWVEAFRSALPTILQTLQQLIQDNKNQYENLIAIVEEKDLKSIRETYQRYIKTFLTKITQYAAYRAEIHPLFDIDTYGRTYPQIEAEYNRWPRKFPLIWSAYQAADQMKTSQIHDTLHSLIGAAHFDRIRRIFSYMILTYEPADKGIGWMESTATVLHGVTADHVNVEKMSREWLYSIISETFAIGICWLTQMYTFLLEHFETHVNEVLLSNNGGFASLSRGHEKFFNLLRLEYHQTTRQMIRRAVEATKYTRYAKMLYVSHNIVNYLRVLTGSIPPTVRSNNHTQMSIIDSNPTKLIYNTEIFLPADRNQQTSNYVPSATNVVHELYTTVRGLLLHDVTTNFYANIVAQFQDSKSIATSLADRIGLMSNEEVAHLSQIDFDEQIHDLQSLYEKLKTLEVSADEIVRATQVFDATKDERMKGKKNESKLIYEQRRERRHLDLMKKLYQVKSKQDEMESVKEEVPLDTVTDDENDILKKLNDDPKSGQMHLADYFRKHDEEDLKFSLLEGEHLEMNAGKTKAAKKTALKSRKSESVGNIADALGKNGPQRTAEPSTTAEATAALSTLANIDQTAPMYGSDESISSKSEQRKSKGDQDKTRTTWYGGSLSKK